MWFFNSKRKEAARLKDEEQRRKVAASQMALLEAATSTADAAHHVTNQLKRNLEDSILQFESTVRILSDGLIVCDAKGIVKAFNPAAELIFGYSAEDILRKPVNDLFRLDDISPVDQNILWDALERDENTPISKLLGQRNNGETFPIEVTISRLTRGDGSLVILVLIRDMTNLLESSKLAETYAHRYRSLFNLSFDGILIVQNGNVMAANNAAGLLFNADPNSLLTTPFSTLVAINQTAMTETNEIGNPVVEAEATRHDGIMLQLLLSSVDITWNDAPARLLTVKDVSHMKQLDSAIRSAQNITQPDMIVCFTPDFQIKFANTLFCDYYKTSSTDIIGTDVRELLTGAEKDAVLLRLHTLSPEYPTRRIQVYAPHMDGTIRLQDWVEHASFDENGIIQEYQRTGRDLTEALSTIIQPVNS